jgi:hypothetical protein
MLCFKAECHYAECRGAISSACVTFAVVATVPVAAALLPGSTIRRFLIFSNLGNRIDAILKFRKKKSLKPTKKKSSSL